MRQQFRQMRSAILIAAIALISFTSCKKEGADQPIDYNAAPRKPAPGIMVGNWLFTQVSSGNIVDQYGHSVPATMFGATFHIEADGKGWEAITSTVNTYTSSNKEDVNTDGTYEIDLDDDGELTLKYYPLRGKLYDNDHFSHYLVPEKLYPNAYYNWSCTLEEYNGKLSFVHNGARYYKQ